METTQDAYYVIRDKEKSNVTHVYKFKGNEIAADYEVSELPKGYSCNCLGFQYNHMCRHVSMVESINLSKTKEKDLVGK